MSWAAHDLEPYVFQRHLGRLGLKVAFVPLLIGSYSPDLATKWFVYGIDVLGVHVGAEDPAQFHRGWPGAGFTHSLTFGVALGLLLWWAGGRVWGISFMIGQWAHALSDVGDTVGSMLFFPFSMTHVHVDAWAYAVEAGRLTDAAAYFSGPGLVWDAFWIGLGLLCWRALRRDYFLGTIVPADPIWRRLGRRIPEEGLLTLYRVAFFYGTFRWAAWLVWAHMVSDYPFDVTWGGPHWVESAHP